MPTTFPLDDKWQFLAPDTDGELRIRNTGPNPAFYVPDPGEQKPPVRGPDAASVEPESEATITGPSWFVAPGVGGAQLWVFD